MTRLGPAGCGGRWRLLRPRGCSASRPQQRVLPRCHAGLQVAGLLWNLVLHRSDLLGNLTSLRNYFLLGRGDFYQQFLDEVGGGWLWASASVESWGCMLLVLL